MRPLALSRWLLSGYGLLALSVFSLSGRPGTTAAAGVLLLVAPLLGLVACAWAVRVLPAALGTAWLLTAGAAGAGLASQVAGAIADAPGSPAAEAQALFFQVSAILLAVAFAWKLHMRDRERTFEILVDNLMLVAAATLVTLHWAPGARAVLTGQLDVDLGQAAAIVGTPIAAGCAILFAFVLAVSRLGSDGGRVVLLLGAGAAALGLAATPLALGQQACCSPDNPAAFAFVVAWTAVAGGAFTAVFTPATKQIAGRGDAGGRGLRLVVAPSVAVIMALVVIDAAWRSPMREQTAITLGLLGMLLALRVSQLLYATHRLSAERLELAQTKMLVDVGQALAGTTDLQTTLQVVTGWARRMLDARAAAIEMPDETGEFLEFRAIDGLPLGIMSMKFPIAGSFSGSVVRHGRLRATADPRREPDISPESLAILGKSAVAAAPLRYHDEILGSLECIASHPFDERDLEMLGALADQAAVAIQNARLFAQVHTLSVTDPLTGLPNRRQLARDLAREFAAARRGRRLVAIMFDLNGFKEYNDRYGHLAGDEALKLFGEVLATETRAMNLVARYGGDEFLALLADADRAGAEVFIERVRARYPGPNAVPPQQELTVSAGLAEYTPEMGTAEDLVAAADRNLYQMKSSRRKVMT